jgi:uncharacterized protein YjbI with pentapeptide repeats
MNSDIPTANSEAKSSADTNLSPWPIDLRSILYPPSWFAIVCTTFIILSALVLFSLAVVAIGQLAIDLLGGDHQRATEAIKLLLPIVAAVVGLPLIVWRLLILNQQTRISEAKTQIDRETHYTTIFSRSVEQLGQTRDIRETRERDGNLETTTRTVPNIEVRLGALYSLERLLRESSKDQPTIIETICAYIRENSPIEPPNESRSSNANPRLAPHDRADVRAALTILGRRPESTRILAKKHGWRLDLRKANLTKYDLSRLNFERADFSGTFLDEANLSESNFAESVFRKAQLRGANLRNSRFQSCLFVDCRISEANFDLTDFHEAEFVETDLTTARLTSLHLEGAKLEKAFSDISLKVTLDLVKQNGIDSFSAQQLLKVYQLFQKATYDDKTNISETTRAAIIFIAQNLSRENTRTMQQ